MIVKDTLDEIAITSNSISILPEVKKGSETSISYHGILSNSGAEKVYLHYGFDGWNNAETIAMKKTLSGAFNTEVRVNGKDELNFCFKDNANNWDNNNGFDWKAEIK
ncbi:MAG: carbohydrate-binding protein [Desulfosporosinus sp.]|nr:carbohydrate-binding protein [Desulfosporosinus sp.]